MKKLILAVLVVVGIATIAGAVFLVAPEEKTNAIREAWRRHNGDLSQKCLDDIRKQLKDPDSARIVHFELVTNPPPYEYQYYLLKYKAKNSYGAYSVSEQGYNEEGKQHSLYNMQKENEKIKAKIEELKKQR